jgi:hypothetical protein
MQFIMPSIGKWIAIVLSLAIGVAALYFRARIPQPEKTDAGFKAAKKKRNLFMMVGVLALWLCSGLILGCFASETSDFTVSISPARVDIFGFSVSSSVVMTWIVIAVCHWPRYSFASLQFRALKNAARTSACFRDRGRRDQRPDKGKIRPSERRPRFLFLRDGRSVHRHRNRGTGWFPSADDGFKHDVFLCVDYVYPHQRVWHL